MRKSKGFKAIEAVAAKHGISVEECRMEISLAIDVAMSNPDPAVRAYWAGVPRKGDRPTPEEFIVYVAEKIRREDN